MWFFILIFYSVHICLTLILMGFNSNHTGVVNIIMIYCVFRMTNWLISLFKWVLPVFVDHVLLQHFALQLHYVMYLNFMCTLFEGQNFRHNLYPAYKSNRPPTPDTIVQGLQYFKASIKAMSIKIIEASISGGFILLTDFKGVI